MTSHQSRNIPTRVGRTCKDSSLCITYQEHPHACGENIILAFLSRFLIGTSPRVWGELGHQEQRKTIRRNIPTRVGRTKPCKGLVCTSPEHPHACGENLVSIAPTGASIGTSPRVWGERKSRIQLTHGNRNIPTRVGRTCRGRKRVRLWPEHPHACGENTSRVGIWYSFHGTSPRVWGEPAFQVEEVGLIRNIPTRVGRTGGQRPRRRLWSEHPHACGENGNAGSACLVRIGTSPRVWGEPLEDPLELGGQRNIPTRVGRTPSRSPSRSAASEHPHACGENFSSFFW